MTVSGIPTTGSGCTRPRLCRVDPTISIGSFGCSNQRYDHADVSLARARVEPGITTRWHTVEAREIYYILQGNGRAEVGEDAWAVGPGDAVSIPPLVRQRIANTGTNELIFLCICTPRFTPEGYREVKE